MYLQWLWTLRRVIDEGSYTKAAASQFMTQSAASQQIRQLERFLNAEVIRREGKELRLTEIGQLVYDFAGQVEREYRQLRSQIEDISGRAFGAVTVVSSTGPLVHFMPPAMKLFWLEHPEIDVKTLSRSGRLISDAVRDGLADFGIEPSLQLDTTLERIPLRQERIVAVAAPAHPLAGLQTVPTDAISDHKIAILNRRSEYRRLVDGWFERHCARPGNILEVAGVEMIRSAALENVAIGILGHYVVADDIANGQLVQLKIEGFDLQQTMYIIHRVDLRESARSLVDTLMRVSGNG